MQKKKNVSCEEKKNTTNKFKRTALRSAYCDSELRFRVSPRLDEDPPDKLLSKFFRNFR